MHRGVRQRVVFRPGKGHAGQVEIVRLAGGQVELLLRPLIAPQCRQLCDLPPHGLPGAVLLAVFIDPHQIAVPPAAVRTVQRGCGGRGEIHGIVLYDDIEALLAAIELAAVQVDVHYLQGILPLRVGTRIPHVRDLQHRPVVAAVLKQCLAGIPTLQLPAAAPPALFHFVAGIRVLHPCITDLRVLDAALAAQHLPLVVAGQAVCVVSLLQRRGAAGHGAQGIADAVIRIVLAVDQILLYPC